MSVFLNGKTLQCQCTEPPWLVTQRNGILVKAYRITYIAITEWRCMCGGIPVIRYFHMRLYCDGVELRALFSNKQYSVMPWWQLNCTLILHVCQSTGTLTFPSWENKTCHCSGGPFLGVISLIRRGANEGKWLQSVFSLNAFLRWVHLRSTAALLSSCHQTVEWNICCTLAWSAH